MSRSPTNGKLRSGAILAVHDGPWGRRVLILAPKGSGWQVSESRSLEPGAPLALQSLCNEHGVARAVRVAPARETLCRSMQLSAAGDEAQLDGTLALLAESELPATVPSYRRVAGVIGLGGDGERCVLLTGWLATASPDSLTSLPETWTTPIASLAALAGDTPKPCAYADPREGAICVVCAGPAKIVPRVTLESTQSDEAWRNAITETLSEACQASGLPAPTALPGGRTLLLDAAVLSGLRARVDGVRDDRAWFDDYGIVLGAALLAADSRSTRRALAQILSLPPIIERNRLVRAIDWLRVPANAWGLSVAAVVCMCGLPIAMAWVRAEVLSSRVAAIREAIGGRDVVEQKAAMYLQLEEERLPVSKLLMDISRAAPDDVVAEQIRIVPKQGLTFRGWAKSSEQVRQFEESLSRSGVFLEVNVGRTEVKTDGVEFDVTAKIPRPHNPVTKAEDFIAKPLAARLYGPETKELPKPTPPPPRTSSRDSAPRDAGSGGERRPSVLPEGPPPAVTDDEIAKMDRPALIKGWTTRKAYVQKNATLDATLKQRLQEEEQKMRARADAIRGGGT